MSTQLPAPNFFSRRTVKILKGAPLHFLCLQIPQLIPELLERFLVGDTTSTAPTLALLPRLIPYFIVASITMAWTAAATFASIQCVVGQRQLSLADSAARTSARFGKLIPAALLAGITILIGFSAYVVPGLILATLYLFIPQLIIDEDASSLMVYFNRSWKLARSHFLQTLGVVIVVTVCSLVLYAVDQALEGWLARVMGSDSLPQNVIPALSTCLSLLITLVTGAVTDVWIGCYFLKLKFKDEIK